MEVIRRRYVDWQPDYHKVASNQWFDVEIEFDDRTRMTVKEDLLTY